MNRMELEYRERRNSDSLKWNHFPSDVIPLWLGELDCSPPVEVLGAISARLAHPVFGYASASSKVNDTVCNYLQVEFGAQVSGDQIVWMPNIDTGLYVSSLYVQPGSLAAVPVPAYPFIYGAVKRAGLRTGRFTIENLAAIENTESAIERLRTAIGGTPSLVVISNPDNPSGKVYSKTELELLSRWCMESGALLCVDEAFADIVYGPRKHYSSILLDYDWVVTLLGPGKGFGVAGIPCGFAIIKDPRLRARFVDTGGPLLRNTNAFSYAACIGAYGSDRGWKRGLLSHLHSNRALVREFAREVGFSISCSEGTYFGWLDCSRIFARDPAEFFLQEARVAVSKGSHFGASGHIRINYGCERSLLQDALQRMRRALTG
jgi:cystathionine beta-lyase